MCIAIVKPADKQISRETFKNCFEANNNGAGFAYAKNGKIKLVKGLMTINAFYSAYDKHNVKDCTALIHFRITTRGADGPDNTHPFMSGDKVLVHNGTMHKLGKVGEGKSDTAIFADLLADMTFDDIKKYEWLIESYTSGNRIAMMSNTGDVHIFNRSSWHEDGGVMYSNTSYKRFQSSSHLYNRYSYGDDESFWWSSPSAPKTTHVVPINKNKAAKHDKKTAVAYTLTDNRFRTAATGVHKGGSPFAFRMDDQFNAQLGYFSKQTGMRMWFFVPKKMDKVLVEMASRLFYSNEDISLEDIRKKLMSQMLEYLRGIHYSEVHEMFEYKDSKQSAKAAAPATTSVAAS